MKTMIYMLLVLSAVLFACSQETNKNNSITKKLETENSISNDVDDIDIIDTNGKTIEDRIGVPIGFERIKVADNSFGKYLRQLPLKPHGSEVKFFDGRSKSNNNVYDAVIDMEIGEENLHQCADAIMRLRAEYLWDQKRYNEIHFNFTNGFRVDYSEWMQGKRIVINGNRSYWIDRENPSNTYQDFWSYMELIFMYAGTLSLSKELVAIDLKDIKIGDVFIRGGSPGHAVIVIDKALNLKTQEKIFLLAQSYMPAQETQVLKNPNNQSISPWYSVDFRSKLITPEWTFSSTELKRFTN